MASTTDEHMMKPPEEPDYTKNVERYDTPAGPRQVTEQETVAGQLSGLLSKGSPLMTQARTRSKQEAQRRGLLSSAMAVQAGELAAMESAMPIAQADASTYAQSGLSSQQAGERRGEMGLGAELQTKTMGAEYGQQGELSALKSDLARRELREQYGLMGGLSARESEQRIAEQEAGIGLQKAADIDIIKATGQEQRVTERAAASLKVGEMWVQADIDEVTDKRQFDQQDKVIASEAKNAINFMREDFKLQGEFADDDLDRQIAFLIKSTQEQKGMTSFEAAVDIWKMKESVPIEMWRETLLDTIEDGNAQRDQNFRLEQDALNSTYANGLQALSNAGQLTTTNIKALTDTYVADSKTAFLTYQQDSNVATDLKRTIIQSKTELAKTGEVTQSNKDITDANNATDLWQSKAEIAQRQDDNLSNSIDNEGRIVEQAIMNLDSEDPDYAKNVQDILDRSNARIETNASINNVDLKPKPKEDPPPGEQVETDAPPPSEAEQIYDDMTFEEFKELMGPNVTRTQFEEWKQENIDRVGDQTDSISRQKGKSAFRNPANMSPTQLGELSYDDIAGMTAENTSSESVGQVKQALIKKYQSENPGLEDAPPESLEMIANMFMESKGLVPKETERERSGSSYVGGQGSSAGIGPPSGNVQRGGKHMAPQSIPSDISFVYPEYPVSWRVDNNHLSSLGKGDTIVNTHIMGAMAKGFQHYDGMSPQEAATKAADVFKRWGLDTDISAIPENYKKVYGWPVTGGIQGGELSGGITGPTNYTLPDGTTFDPTTFETGVQSPNQAQYAQNMMGLRDEWRADMTNLNMIAGSGEDLKKADAAADQLLKDLKSRGKTPVTLDTLPADQKMAWQDLGVDDSSLIVMLNPGDFSPQQVRDAYFKSAKSIGANPVTANELDIYTPAWVKKAREAQGYAL